MFLRTLQLSTSKRTKSKTENREEKLTVEESIFADFRNKLDSLSKLVVQQYKSHRNIEHDVLREWLQVSNVLNMQRVSKAFYRGNFFYESDTYHFASQKNLGRPYDALTTVPHLEPIVYSKGSIHKTKTIMPKSYMIDDSCHKPSQLLEDLLLSYTAMECCGSINIMQHLTLLDLFILIFGDTQLFDELFSPKRDQSHNFNRLRLGIMGPSENSSNLLDFSPIYFFQDFEIYLSLNDIKNNPKKYIGSCVYIKGHRNYLRKHEFGESQGWNAIVIGINADSEVLFLVANEKGKKYIYTYRELISMLAHNYNLFSNENNMFVAETCEAKEIGKLSGFANMFNVKRINELICHFDKMKIKLKQYCDKFYQNMQVTRQYVAISNPNHPYFISKNIINNVKDDHDRRALLFFKIHRKDIPLKRALDDIDVDYRRPSKSYSKYSRW